jgi:hypothetical protein
MNMTARVADRVGLTATGLTAAGISPTQARSWLERVRLGGLDATESAATLLLVYRLWLVGLALKALGSGWDVAWHFRWLRDDFAPPHDVNLIGDGLIIALILFHWYTRFGVDRIALRLMLGGISLFLFSVPVDVLNHRINGLDITSWSVTHFGLYTGTGILIAGAIRGWRLHAAPSRTRTSVLGGLWFFFLENVWFPNQHQEYGIEEIRSFDRGHIYAEPSLMKFAADQIGHPMDRASVVHFSLPVPPWVYPVWIATAVVLALLLARRSVGLRWTATALAAAFVAWRCLIWPLLHVAGFPTSALPFLLILVGVAVDLACLARVPWFAEATLGAALAVACVYLAAFAQSVVTVAPPIAYWSAPVAGVTLFVAWSTFAYLRTRWDATPF